MTSNGDYKFVLERIKFPGVIVLNQQERNYCCGRGKENKIACPSLAVSRKHCTFFCTANELFVMDLKSSNGLFINGQPQQSHVMIKLNDDDIIGIGCRDIDDKDIEIKEEDRFVYRLSIIIENVEETTLPHSSKNKDEKSPERATTNKDTESTRKRIQEITEDEVPKKQMKHENETPKETAKTLPERMNSMDEQNENDIEIIHVSLNESKLDQSDCNSKNNSIQSSSNPRLSLIEKVPSGTKKSTSTNQSKKDDADSVKAKEVPPKNTRRTKCTGEQRISLDEITSKQNNTLLLDDLSKKQMPEPKSSRRTTQKTFRKPQEDESRNSHDETIPMQNGHARKSSKPKANEAKKTTPLPQISPSKLVQYGDTLIKQEEELQITDTEEETYMTLSKNEIVAPSPIKLKQIKREPKTRFSEVDIVNISDDEDDVFPCSQLFDTNFGSDGFVKEEIKEESSAIDNDRFERPDNGDIILSLSDSEDEANPWLEKLSRSQTEDSFLETTRIKKEEIDIMEVDPPNDAVDLNQAGNDRESRLSFVAQKLPDENELYKPVIDGVCNMASAIASTNAVTSSLDARPQKAAEKDANVEAEDRVSSSSGAKADKPVRVSPKQKVIERKVPEIEPLPFPAHRKHSGEGIRTKETRAKPVESRMTSQERREKKLEEKKAEYLYKKEQKHRKQRNKWADCLPPGVKKKALSLSKEEKRKLTDHRKAKLKEIAIEEKRLSLESKEDKKRIGTKPKAKLTIKSRADLLLNDQLNLDTSKTSLNASAEKPSESNNETHEPSAPAPVTNATTTKSKSKDTAKQPVNKISNNFEEFLKLCEKPEKFKIPKKTSSKTDATEEITDRVKKSLTITGDQPVKHTAASKAGKPESHESSAALTNGTAKKRVTFAQELKTVREYFIDPENTMRKFTGKDAPIPQEKLPAKQSAVKACPKIEDFLFRIFNWKPVWLEEQRQFNTIAPAVPEHELLPMLTHYKTYTDYYKIVSPLLLLEIWCGITKEFETVDSNIQRPTLMCSIVENSITWPSANSPNSHSSTLLLEVLITKEGAARQAYPNYGDLVFFEYTRNQGRQHEFHKVFAYVTNVYQTVLTPHTHYNKELRKHVQNPYMLITYTMLTRALENDICVNRVQRLRTVTYLRATMRLVQALQYLPQSALMKSILNPQLSSYQLPIIHNVQARPLITNDKLNTKQLEAVFKVTDTVIQKEPKLCFIQGPPGTGKSTVIVNIITQILYGDNRYKNHNSCLRILVCAPSNAAIDEIVLRLLNIRASLKGNRFKMVRIGRPETMHPVVKDISLTELAKRDVRRTAESYASNQIPNDSVEEEKSFLQAKINALRCEVASSYNKDEAYKKNIKMRLADMNAKYDLLRNRKPFVEMNPREFAKLQRAAENKLLEYADIITCTLSSCYNAQMESLFGGVRERISVCIVDEATQSCEAETLIPLMLGVNTLVLVGDTNQLPATVISQRAKKLGLDQSIFARVQNAFDGLPNNPIMLLDTQYRMAHAVSYWPNKFFYAGKLKNGVQHSGALPFHQYRILSLNSSQNNDKFSNTDEAEFVANLVVCMLHHTSMDARKIELSFGIMTPYQIQRSLILEKLNERMAKVPEVTRKKTKIDVNTIDAFQGQERDVIIMSCVRSNGIGFLSDRQRLCVALTRAKHCLVLCGNFNTFMRDQMWGGLLNDAKARGVYQNVNARAHPNEIKTWIVKS